jgi:hypothetical protein
MFEGQIINVNNQNIMKTKNINLFHCLWIAGITLTSCFPEQDVEPIDSPDDNPIVTITPAGDYSSLKEGDTLRFVITVDKMLPEDVDFAIQLAEGSTADDHDYVSEAATLAAYSTSTTLTVIVAGDHETESAEKLAFTIVPDFHWDFLLNPAGDKEPVDATVKDLTYSLDWSAGSYEDQGLCEWEIDFDLYAENADGSEGNYDGASAACPIESGNLGLLPDGTYGIYAQYWDGGIPAAAGVEMPYTVTFSDNKGGLYTIEGAFNSDDVKRTIHEVATVVISGGTYTVFDANGTELGKM